MKFLTILERGKNLYDVWIGKLSAADYWKRRWKNWDTYDPYYLSKLKATEYLGKTEMKDYVNESRDLKSSKN